MIQQKLGHLAITRERLRIPEFIISWFLLIAGFLTWILALCMCGIDGYNHIIPKFIPVLSVFTGLNTLV